MIVMLLKELIGMEIIDKAGETVGLVEDFMIDEKGKVTHLIVLPKGIVSKMTRSKLNVEWSDINAIEDVVMLKKSEEQLRK
ncbi:MAG: PRC-barrel domain-containing protein [Candidatus Diapherotrites archaeon]|nr:PRC-barrel domain-containing protein [Candidatus Diapherotrites archaeon]